MLEPWVAFEVGFVDDGSPTDPWTLNHELSLLLQSVVWGMSGTKLGSKQCLGRKH